MRCGYGILLGLLVTPLLLCGPSKATAGGWVTAGANFAVSCENGANYRLHADRASFPGDVVTGHFYLSRHRSLPVRLIPMGEGYRYAGRGVWLDGIREHALLYLSKYRPLACVVSRL